ncbi:hypothetical protein LENED_005814 [Lentinula edodes]|uniref:Uncharacterized protein n=1 Tax=Lentinula edodes TaxID=5353 RepID=A0A1Q3EA14_LENED|nr:hypothetical protein LENED_005814 [Lentinula edodes]
MLTPYIPYDLKPNVAADLRVAERVDHISLAWASPAYELCSTIHTSYIAKSLSGRMTPSERLLLGAVQDTTKEICRVLVKMWATGVEVGLDAKYWCPGETVLVVMRKCVTCRLGLFSVVHLPVLL